MQQSPQFFPYNGANVSTKRLQVAAAAVGIGVIAGLWSCATVTIIESEARPIQRQCLSSTSSPTSAPSDSMHDVSKERADILLKNGYCDYRVYEYHDEQRLSNGGTDYGPIAKVYAFTAAASIDDRTVFNSWVNVAIITVDAGTVPGPYNALHLQTGMNCMFLKYPATGGGGWSGMITPVDASGMCSNTSGAQIPVQFQKPDPDPSHYPHVARFVEGVGRVPFIGVKCADAWCIVGPGSQAMLKAPSFNGLSGVGTSPQWNISGWFDDQTVGNLAAAGNFGILPSVPLSVVPKEDLGLKDVTAFTNDWVDVATIIVPPTLVLPAKYAGMNPGYGLLPGTNTLSIHRQLESGAMVWRARMSNPARAGYYQLPHQVTWTDHSTETSVVPATARWRWNDLDEEVWVRCDIGCCRVTSLM
jgi:hypothetical protein